VACGPYAAFRVRIRFHTGLCQGDFREYRIIFSPGGRAFKPAVKQPAAKQPIRESLGFSRSLDYKRVWKAKPPLSPREKKSGTTEILSLNCPMTCFFQSEVPSAAH
jgi:hypothetical protein